MDLDKTRKSSSFLWECWSKMGSVLFDSDILNPIHEKIWSICATGTRTLESKLENVNTADIVGIKYGYYDKVESIHMDAECSDITFLTSTLRIRYDAKTKQLVSIDFLYSTRWVDKTFIPSRAKNSEEDIMLVSILIFLRDNFILFTDTYISALRQNNNVIIKSELTKLSADFDLILDDDCVLNKPITEWTGDDLMIFKLGFDKDYYLKRYSES